MSTSDSGTLSHPTTLRRKPVTRSIRHRDLTRSAARIRVHEAARAVCAHRRQLRPERDRRGLRTDLVRHESGDVRTGNAARHPGHGERRTAPRRGSPHGCDPLAPPVGDGRRQAPRPSRRPPVDVVRRDLRHARRGRGPAGARQLRSGGLSQDGSRAVVARTQRRSTTFAIVSRTGERRVVLGTNAWSFDALSGTKLYLLQNQRNGYNVRLYDLAANKLAPQPLKDAEESALISGIAWDEAVVGGRPLPLHALHLECGSGDGARARRARGNRALHRPARDGTSTPATTYALVADPDGRTLWAASPGDGKVVSIDVAAARVRDSFGFFGRPADSPGSSVAAIAPDGGHLAVSSAGKLWFVTLAKRTTQVRSRLALALAFSPDGRRLRTLGEKSRSRPCPSLRPRAPPRSRSRSRSRGRPPRCRGFALNTRS